MYFLNPKFQVSSHILWLYSLLWVGLFWTCASWLGCPLLKILMNNLLVGVICFISTLYINLRVNMVIVSSLEGMGIFSACRVYFKYFLTKIYLNMCSDMLFYPNAFSCDILAFCSEPLSYRKKHIRNIIPKFGFR